MIETASVHHYDGPYPARIEDTSRCRCASAGFADIAAGVERVAALVAAGVSQRDACLLVWGDPGEQHKAGIRAAFREAFAWLRLPERAA